MKLLSKNNKIIAVVQDHHQGGTLHDIPEGFDARQLDKYNIVDGVVVSAPPSTVSMRQFRLALLDSGLLTSVNSHITSLTGDAKKRAQIEFEYNHCVEIQSPFVQSLKQALSLTDSQIDQLFVQAGLL
jgi:hypothetical protein